MDKIKTNFRPIFHITPKKGWINDPNGFTYFQGAYHIYTQYNPYDTKWGPMHWLHFKSKDLISWEELGVALKPSEPSYDLKYGCFSGSTVIKDNKMYVYYTGATEGRQVQCLAICEDGEHFKKYEGNPILNARNLPKGYLIKDFRDPKVFEANGLYYMLVVARHKDNYSSILLYQSKDLYHFKYKGILKSFTGLEFDGMVECPDLIFQDDKCALIYSLQNRFIEDDHVNFAIWYQVGKIDLEKAKFIPLGEERKLDNGFDAYASQTIQKDNKTYITYWESIWGINWPTEIEGYAGQLSLFKELVIDNDTLKMKFLDGQDVNSIEGNIVGDIAKIRINNVEIILNKKKSIIELTRKDMDFIVKKEDGETLDKKIIHHKIQDKVLLEYVVDHSCFELSLNHGEVFMSLLNLNYDNSVIEVKTENIK